jgi:hypothetical protein
MTNITDWRHSGSVNESGAWSAADAYLDLALAAIPPGLYIRAESRLFAHCLPLCLNGKIVA